MNPDLLGIPFGKFHLLERLGRGGMAEVWKAKALGPMGYARKLVVKRILPELIADEEFVRMFVAEARLSASLNHRNIVQVYEFGEVGGEFYLAMEWVHGRDLSTLLRTMREKDELPSVGLAAYVAREVCRALAYAHALTDEDGLPLKLIHRDVSPSNVMVGFDGSVKLLDFGIAKALAVASENRTQVGVLKGKFGYMAPEQVDCDSDAIDHRADLFVAGIVLWEMLTLRRLFKGSHDVQTIGLVRAAKVLPPSTLNPAVTPALDAVCARALARRPEERFTDCHEMAAALDECVHALKFGSEHASRQMRMHFPDVREPTQQLAIAAILERTPSSPPALTPTPKGQRLEHAATSLMQAQPSAPTALRKALHRTGAPSLTPERRVLMTAATLLALAGVVAVARRPQAAAPTPVAPIAIAPWLTTAAEPVVAGPVVHAEPGPKPATVTVRLLTRPAGARVTVEGENAPRGVTPLVLTLAKAATATKLVLSAPGYQRAVAEVTPDVDSKLYVELSRVWRGRRAAAPKRVPAATRLPAEGQPSPGVAPAAPRGIRGGD